jgi:hypothetical protein
MIRWTGLVAHLGEKRNAYMIRYKKHDGKR